MPRRHPGPGLSPTPSDCSSLAASQTLLGTTLLLSTSLRSTRSPYEPANQSPPPPLYRRYTVWTTCLLSSSVLYTYCLPLPIVNTTTTAHRGFFSPLRPRLFFGIPFSASQTPTLRLLNLPLSCDTLLPFYTQSSLSPPLSTCRCAYFPPAVSAVSSTRSSSSLSPFPLVDPYARAVMH
ncbi:hypothetical protein F5Y09DRAFT_6666 [Xylaria sp. FL1042]|nr:hypothetical protein F5Y09DRAFT_6666 [Xylaria sp. FL1042]